MEKAIQGIIDLLNLLITHYGQTGTLLIALFILVVIGVWRWYNDWKSEQRINQLLKEKDITIQRLAKSERE
jgi:sensor domain CHASE-containing protein